MTDCNKTFRKPPQQSGPCTRAHQHHDWTEFQRRKGEGDRHGAMRYFEKPSMLDRFRSQGLMICRILEQQAPNSGRQMTYGGAG